MIRGFQSYFYRAKSLHGIALLARTLYFRWVCCFCLIASFSLDLHADYKDHITCAVYHRMLIGGLKSRGLDELTYAESEKMNTQIDLANLAGDTTFESFSQNQFNQDWATILKTMTDQINNSYRNIYILKARYQTRCKALQETISSP